MAQGETIRRNGSPGLYITGFKGEESVMYLVIYTPPTYLDSRVNA